MACCKRLANGNHLYYIQENNLGGQPCYYLQEKHKKQKSKMAAINRSQTYNLLTVSLHFMCDMWFLKVSCEPRFKSISGTVLLIVGIFTLLCY